MGLRNQARRQKEPDIPAPSITLQALFNKHPEREVYSDIVKRQETRATIRIYSIQVNTYQESHKVERWKATVHAQ